MSLPPWFSLCSVSVFCSKPQSTPQMSWQLSENPVLTKTSIHCSVSYFASSVTSRNGYVSPSSIYMYFAWTHDSSCICNDLGLSLAKCSGHFHSLCFCYFKNLIPPHHTFRSCRAERWLHTSKSQPGCLFYHSSAVGRTACLWTCGLLLFFIFLSDFFSPLQDVGSCFSKFLFFLLIQSR